MTVGVTTYRVTDRQTDRQTDASDIIICPKLCYSSGTDNNNKDKVLMKFSDKKKKRAIEQEVFQGVFGQKFVSVIFEQA